MSSASSSESDPRLSPRAPLRPWVSLSPAKHAARLKSLALAGGHEYRCADPAYRPDWTSVAFADGSKIDFDHPLPQHLPEQGVGFFPDGVVYNQQGWPIVNGDSVPIDAIFVHEQHSYRRYQLPTRVRPPRQLEGTVVNLGSAFSATNYGHTLLDGLSRIGILQKAGFDLSEADHVLIPSFPSASIIPLLKRCGVTAKRVKTLESGAHFHCETLVQTTFPGRPRVYSQAPARFMRSLGISGATGKRRRLMLLREGLHRSVINVEECQRLAEKFDLELYDPLKSAFPPADFAAAELVVGALGAALADIGFCSPGTAIIELMPSSYRYPYFATLAVSSGLNYVALDCASESSQRKANFHVNVDHLEQAILATGVTQKSSRSVAAIKRALHLG